MILKFVKVESKIQKDFSGGSDGKNLPAMQEVQETQVPGSGRSPGEGNGNPLQNSCLENSMDRGAWGSSVHGGHKESDTTEQLSLSQNAKAPLTLASNLWDNFRRHNQFQSEKYLLIKKFSLIKYTWDSKISCL